MKYHEKTEIDKIYFTPREVSQLHTIQYGICWGPVVVAGLIVWKAEPLERFYDVLAEILEP